MIGSARFRAAYARHRAVEGRGTGGTEELWSLPYQPGGPWARHWQVRARSYERFVRAIIAQRARKASPRPLEVLDLGAGNGWLCYRLAERGHRAVALDWRSDQVDGLGAAAGYAGRLPAMFPRVAASFEAIPLAAARFDVVAFNAALHYAVNLETALAEAARVTSPGGSLVILDSPFYRDARHGEQMVAEKHRTMTRNLGDAAADLLALPAIEYLTRQRLESASQGIRLHWTRHRVRYPLWYEWRRVSSRLRGRRPPSRFDIWEALVAG